jgi:hypothetical protein
LHRAGARRSNGTVLAYSTFARDLYSLRVPGAAGDLLLFCCCWRVTCSAVFERDAGPEIDWLQLKARAQVDCVALASASIIYHCGLDAHKSVSRARCEERFPVSPSASPSAHPPLATVYRVRSARFPSFWPLASCSRVACSSVAPPLRLLVRDAGAPSSAQTHPSDELYRVASALSRMPRQPLVQLCCRSLERAVLFAALPVCP